MFSNILSLALLTGAAMACPPTKSDPSSPIMPGDKFGLMALRSASPIHFSQFQAARSSLFLHLPHQNATCDDGSHPEDASFVLGKDGSISLYSAHGPHQQLFVDRSGMGQGKLGYTTGGQHGPRYGERTAFKVDQYGDVTFNGAGFIACPGSLDGAWSVWVYAGNANPGGNKDCLGLAARAVKETTAKSCSYTQSS